MNTSFSRRSLAAALLTLSVAPATLAQKVDTYYNRNLPAECAAQMRTFVAAGKEIMTVAFPPAGGNSWSIVTDSGFFNRNVPQELHDKMVAYSNAGHKILCVAFPPAGGNRWTLITDKTFFNRGVPQELHDTMVTQWNSGRKPVWVAYPPAGGNSWSLVTDKGFANRNIPQECHTQMGTFFQAGHKIRCVAFPTTGGNSWSIVTDKGFFNRATPTHLHRVMRAMVRFPGGPLKMVAFAPGGQSFSIVSDTHPDGIPSTIDAGAEYWSLDKFANNLRAEMSGKGVKFAFAIRHGAATRSFGAGAKRTAFTPPAQEFTIYDRFNPASCGKTITALALLRALQNRGVSINEYIYKWLPSFWTKPASMQSITFKELLNHTSGFRASSGTTTFAYDYNGMRQMVAAGINPANKVPEYENVNYALARICTAYLNYYSERGVLDHGKATSDNFMAFVQTVVMDPIGAPDVEWKPDTVEPTLFFKNPVGTSTGTTYGDWTLQPGSAGVHISMAEFNSVLTQLRTSTSILGTAKKNEMNTYNLGWSKGNCKNGQYYTKGGFFPGGPKTGGGVWNGGAELHAYVIQFSSGVEVTAVLNGYVSFDVIAAYNNAWAPKLIKATGVTASIANVTAGSLVVSGENLDVASKAIVGSTVITNKVYTDPTVPYIRPLSSSLMLVHLPQGLAAGDYKVQVASSLSTSAALPFKVVKPTTPTLLVTPQPIAGQNYRMALSAGPLRASFAYLAISDSAVPSRIPGVFDFDIGNSFQTLFFWPLPIQLNASTGVGQVTLPSIASLRGQTFYFQALLAASGSPIPVSNMATVRFQ